MLSRAGIRMHSDLGRKLQTIVRERHDPQDEQTVKLTDREEAQMYLPFLLTRLQDISDEKLNCLFENCEDMGMAIKNWPEQPLDDKEYNELVEVIQRFNQEVVMFMILDNNEAKEVIDEAIEKLEQRQN